MSFDLFFQNAVALHQAGKLDEAEQSYRQLLEIAPEHTDLLHLLGMIALQKGAFDSALDFLYKAVKLAPDAAAYRFTDNVAQIIFTFHTVIQTGQEIIVRLILDFLLILFLLCYINRRADYCRIAV